MSTNKNKWFQNRLVCALACAAFSFASVACGNESAGGNPEDEAPDAGSITTDAGENPIIWEDEDCTGAQVIMTTSEEPAGSNCKWGGTRIDSGLDANCNQQLDSEEISQTAYSCNGSMVETEYKLENLGDSTLSLKHNDQKELKFRIVDQTQTPVANSKIDLTVAMKPGRSASFSETVASASTTITTNERGEATAVLYSSSVDAQGTITAIARDISANPQTISVSIQKEESIDDPVVPGVGKGSLKVNIINDATPDVQKALVRLYFIDEDDTEPYCDRLILGENIGFDDNSRTVNVSSGTGTTTFNNIEAGQRVVTFVKGQTSGSIDVGTNACTTSSVIEDKATESVFLTLAALPEETVNLDQGYDTLLHLNLTSVMPETWQKWFNIIDELFQNPTGTALYYALHAWEYRGNFATTGGGSSLTIPENFPVIGNTTINVWDTVVGNNSSLTELMINCDIATGTKTGTCPEYSITVQAPLIGPMTFGPWTIFPLIVNAAENALNNIEGFGTIYDNIKTVGNNLTSMAKSFDVGARFGLKQKSDTTVDVTETWSHVIWTWQLLDQSPACDKNDPMYDAKICGRHAFSFADEDLKGSAVNETYVAIIQSMNDNAVQFSLPSDHPFTLRYGNLLKVLINKVVAPAVMGNDKDMLNSDGESYRLGNGKIFVENPYQAGQEDEMTLGMGALLNYWVPCTKISKGVYDWVSNLNIEQLGNIGAMIAQFLSQETLDGYCVMGLNAASDYAMGQLDQLVADAKLNVRAGSTFELTDFHATGNELIPQELNNLNYRVGITVEEKDEETGATTSTQSYDATITGEGILAKSATPSVEQCADFLHLSDDAAFAACGN